MDSVIYLFVVVFFLREGEQWFVEIHVVLGHFSLLSSENFPGVVTGS